VIEDDPATRELLEKVLASSGYDVTAARDGTEGLRLAAERAPALVTLDLLMPDVDGREVLRRLREQTATRDVPVVVVSCLDRGGSGLRAAADAYLVKPIDRVEFLATVRRLVNREPVPPQGDHPPA
jgi:DNA-binding response OmpR family regulator